MLCCFSSMLTDLWIIQIFLEFCSFSSCCRPLPLPKEYPSGLEWIESWTIEDFAQWLWFPKIFFSVILVGSDEKRISYVLCLFNVNHRSLTFIYNADSSFLVNFFLIIVNTINISLLRIAKTNSQSEFRSGKHWKCFAAATSELKRDFQIFWRVGLIVFKKNILSQVPICFF